LSSRPEVVQQALLHAASRTPNGRSSPNLLRLCPRSRANCADDSQSQADLHIPAPGTTPNLPLPGKTSLRFAALDVRRSPEERSTAAGFQPVRHRSATMAGRFSARAVANHTLRRIAGSAAAVPGPTTGVLRNSPQAAD